jgi:hypothetical protein
VGGDPTTPGRGHGPDPGRVRDPLSDLAGEVLQRLRGRLLDRIGHAVAVASGAGDRFALGAHGSAEGPSRPVDDQDRGGDADLRRQLSIEHLLDRDQVDVEVLHTDEDHPDQIAAPEIGSS